MNHSTSEHAEELRDLLGRDVPSQAVCDAMLQLALDRGARDNVTAVVARFLVGETPAPA